MSIQKTPLEIGKYYHIYNRGIDSCVLFRDKENYEYFLDLYDKYISPVANTYAWVLMNNHFHFVIYVLPEDCWGKLPQPENYGDLRRAESLRPLSAENRVNKQFSNFFNAYTKAFNKRYCRTGSLFEHPFRRKLNYNMDYLKKMIIYTHQNPFKHGVCSHPIEYPWSSYLSCLSLKPTKLQRDKVIACFGNTDTFKIYHNQAVYSENIDEWIELE